MAHSAWLARRVRLSNLRTVKREDPLVIWNIIDRRKRKYRWLKINAIIEATWHDNSCKDADIAPSVRAEDEITYEEREGITLHEAVVWGNNQSCPVTLFLYDAGCGIG
jgi:hypothetical protein